MSLNTALINMYSLTLRRMGNRLITETIGGRIFDGDIADSSRGETYTSPHHIADKDSIVEVLFSPEELAQKEAIYNHLLEETDEKTANKYISQSILKAMQAKHLIITSKNEKGEFEYHLTQESNDYFASRFAPTVSAQKREELLFISIGRGVVDFDFKVKRSIKNQENLERRCKNESLDQNDLDFINTYLRELGNPHIVADSFENGIIWLKGLEKNDDSKYPVSSFTIRDENTNPTNGITPQGIADMLGVFRMLQSNATMPDPRSLAEQGFNLVESLENSPEPTMYALQYRSEFLKSTEKALHEIESFIKKHYDPEWESGEVKPNLSRVQKEQLKIFTELHQTISEKRAEVDKLIDIDVTSAQKNIFIDVATIEVNDAIKAAEANPTAKEHKGFFAKLLSFFDKIKNFFSNKETREERATAIKAIKALFDPEKSTDDDREGEGEHPHPK